MVEVALLRPAGHPHRHGAGLVGGALPGLPDPAGCRRWAADRSQRRCGHAAAAGAGAGAGRPKPQVCAMALGFFIGSAWV